MSYINLEKTSPRLHEKLRVTTLVFLKFTITNIKILCKTKIAVLRAHILQIIYKLYYFLCNFVFKKKNEFYNIYLHA